jgi:hypothetical protein
VALLEEAVREFEGPEGWRRGKVPWKKVATYIKEMGGSYHFGNATCRKRWDELVRGEEERLRDELGGRKR